MQREVDVEHRWGIRRKLDVGIKLHIRSSLPMFGRLLNASSSGAYVATSATLPIMTRLDVSLGWDRFRHGSPQRIAAHVVRTDARGIGIEWQQFAPPAVLALIDIVELTPSRSCREKAGTRRPASSPHP